MSADHLHGFYLNDLFIEPLKGQVTGKGESRHLPPKAVEVLLCLARTPGELVTRDTLLSEVWGHGRGSHEALSHAISEVRHALGDHADDPVFVQTLPKRGYRLAIAPTLDSEHTESIVIGSQGATGDPGLFQNLNRRGVLETGIAYLVLGWLLIQIADIVFAQLHLPLWAGTFVTLLVIAGLPIALALSWFLDFRGGKAVIDSLSPADSRRQRFSRTYISVIFALVAASGLVFFYDQQVGLPTSEEQAPEPALPASTLIPIVENSIAVLPFLNVDGSEETKTFANGLVDDVINRLARVPGLRVSSRGDAFSLNPNSASRAVRQRLRVAMYIEGSVEIATDSIRVIVQLINSADGFHIQARTFDYPRENYFRIRDEITQLTVSSLRVTLPEDTQALSPISSHNPDFNAYVLYRRGMEELQKPGTLNTLSVALGWMDAALEADPEFAAAYAGKCRAYIALFRENDDPGSMIDAEKACARALGLNPNLDVVHNALGALYKRTGKYPESEAAHLEALHLNPQSVDSMIDLADVYRLLKRPDEAEDLLRSAIGLQPGNWQSFNALGYFLFQQGRYSEAATQYKYVVSLDSRNIRGLSGLGTSYMLAGDFAAAAPVFARSIDVEPQADTFGNLGLMYYYLGQYDDAVKAIESGIEIAPNDYWIWMNLGDVLTNAGRGDDAQDAFARARALMAPAIDVDPNDPFLLLDMAWVEAMSGEELRALESIRKAAVALPDDPYVDYISGLIHNRFGNTNKTLAALQTAVDKGYSKVLLAAEPHLQNLHADNRFAAIVGTVP